MFCAANTEKFVRHKRETQIENFPPPIKGGLGGEVDGGIDYSLK